MDFTPLFTFDKVTILKLVKCRPYLVTLKPDFINHCVTSYEKPLTTMMNSKISKICGEPSESGVTVAGEQVFSFAVTK